MYWNNEASPLVFTYFKIRPFIAVRILCVGKREVNVGCEAGFYLECKARLRSSSP